MYAKQYEITLPVDHDMSTIRARVAAAGPILDDHAGLGLKAYLIRERGVGGSPVNQYAPFYLWNDVGAMAEFVVGGGGFQNVIRDFGRPVVHHWTGVARESGPARDSAPRWATRRLTDVPTGSGTDGLGTAEAVRREIDALRELARHDGVHTAALAVDPGRWSLVRFVLWRDAPGEPDGAAERYEVLHLSAPHLDDLPEGRAW
ncbi:DUF4865 family protein [Nocardiopsis sp. EMB25]|uniref:DUF4865 family protein n=1 Tax=Nocardiopsis sp. EMB25 TaxID=2835867 RepID=UPI002283668E|nr:DUF4865 family protein [Nocardiopsis sp. EMB25]MCY9786302.1 DUF4865 family protein [Nocardiopsis sp. EMB25]